jgi:uncharacterized protein YcfL
MRRLKLGAVVTAVVLLVGCGSAQVAGLRTFQEEVMPSQLPVRQTALKPEFRYLLVESKGQEALMIWVGTERSALGETTVWMSADGVVIRLVQGRLVGVSEPHRSWRLVSESPTNTSSASRSQFIQTSDEHPGFSLGIQRTINKVELPLDPKTTAWAVVAQDLRWTQEVDISSGQRLALHGTNAHNHTMAGQRCLTPEWCLRWQAWPAKTTTSPL